MKAPTLNRKRFPESKHKASPEAHGHSPGVRGGEMQTEAAGVGAFARLQASPCFSADFLKPKPQSPELLIELLYPETLRPSIFPYRDMATRCRL